MLLFFHCHKAAGTTVTKAATKSGMKLAPGHRNGNPVDADGKVIKWGDLNEDATLEVFSALERDGVDLVAFEFSFPPWATLAKLPNTRVFTVLREPAARAFSNYRMDVANGYVSQERVFGFYSFMNNASLIRSHNYYTRFFSGVGPRAKITQDHLHFAKKRLAEFETVCIVEHGNLADHLGPFGFEPSAFRWENSSNHNRKVREVNKQGEFDLATFPDDPQFFADNCFDYALYAHFLNRQVKASLAAKKAADMSRDAEVAAQKPSGASRGE